MLRSIQCVTISKAIDVPNVPVPFFTFQIFSLIETPPTFSQENFSPSSSVPKKFLFFFQTDFQGVFFGSWKHFHFHFFVLKENFLEWRTEGKSECEICLERINVECVKVFITILTLFMKLFYEQNKELTTNTESVIMIVPKICSHHF